MPARDLYHPQVKNALVKDGWTITDDPYRLTFGQGNLYVDLGAERLLAAERLDEKIAVEIKSFLSPSDARDLENALGQYVLYRSVMSRSDSERKLFLAVSEIVYNRIFVEPATHQVILDLNITLLVFDPVAEKIVRWTN